MPNKQKQYFNEREVSEFTGISLSSLRNDRHLSRGLPYIKLGKSVRYDLRDVISHMESHRVQPMYGITLATSYGPKEVSQ
jgi:predicted DNA-binding transcriptional regulator AlpA